MNYYIDLMKNTVEYIEQNMNEKLSLDTISHLFCVSAFHYNRIFKTVTGITLKQYILGRKLACAATRLRDAPEPIIDIAYNLGFEYPEVFSRAFKKQFGLSPSRYRAEQLDLNGVEKAVIVERSFVNYQGSLALKEDFIQLTEALLFGSKTEANENGEDFQLQLQTESEKFLCRAKEVDGLNQDLFYAVVNCHGEDSGAYTVFYGMEAQGGKAVSGFDVRVIPGGRYARFVYTGDMFKIRESFIDDLYRWVIVKEIRLKYNGIGMIALFKKDYPTLPEVQILVPVDGLQIQQEKS